MEAGGGGRREAGLDFLLELTGLSLSAPKFASFFSSILSFLLFFFGHMIFISLAGVEGAADCRASRMHACQACLSPPALPAHAGVR